MRPIDADKAKLKVAVEVAEQKSIINDDGFHAFLDGFQTLFNKNIDKTQTEGGMWTTHEVACLLAEATGTDCACDVNGNDEWLPSVCEIACPNVVGVACWEQWLKHRKEKTNDRRKFE